MTDPNPEPEPLTQEQSEPLEPAVMPKWVPLLIGIVLVIIAAFAVVTGLRYHDGNTMADHVEPRRPQQRNASAPPGEPGAGASLVLPGENAPVGGAPVTGRARAVIQGGPGGVQSTVRIWARRGLVLNVLPEDAMVYVNELRIGQVRQFNSMDEVYEFPEPGSYNVRIVAANGAQKTYVITVAEDAPQDVARISAKL